MFYLGDKTDYIVYTNRFKPIVYSITQIEHTLKINLKIKKTSKSHIYYL